jgi:hypothetical protein
MEPDAALARDVAAVQDERLAHEENATTKTIPAVDDINHIINSQRFNT